VLIGDHETTSGDPPLRAARAAPALVMMRQQRRLDIQASEAKLVRLVERVKRPAD
jgi:hypothetical protein